MVGEQIGRYRLDAEIGRGGMGVVYKATQVTLDRTVAVKMLPRQMADEENLERFRREARTLAQLAHQGIVHIYDVEEHEGSHFIIMEHVGGGSLGDLIEREAPLPVERAVEITAQVASALAAAHRRGIIHRDIKPDNILFDDNGRAKLTDFGIAHMRDANSKTKTGVMLGTPYYMSPEQARGRPVTPASDLYAVGVLLYEMLSGSVPFTGEDAVAIAIKHIQEAPESLAERAPAVPAEVVAIVERLMAKNAEDRFDSADALVGAFRSGWGIGSTTLGSTGSGAAVPDALSPESEAVPQHGDAPTAVGAGVAKKRPSLPGAVSISNTLNAPSMGGFPRSFWIGLATLAVVVGLVVIPRLGGAADTPPDRDRPSGPGAGGATLPQSPFAPNSGPERPAVVISPQDVASIADVLDDDGGSGSQSGDNDTPGPVDPNPAPADPVTPAEPSGPTPSENDREPRRTEPAFDANAERAAIRGMLERQRRATESGDLNAMLRDVHPDMRDVAREAGRQMFDAATDLQAEVSDIQIEFEDEEVAGVVFYGRQTGVLRANGQRVVLAEGWTQYILVKEGGRWLIAGW